MSLTPDTIAWLGLFLGVLGRVGVPYLRKLWAGEIKTFDIYYIWQGFAGFGLALVVAVLMAPNVLINASATFVQLLFTNFVVGFGAESIINEVFAIGQTSASKESPQQPS